MTSHVSLGPELLSTDTHTHTKAGVGNKLARKDADVAYLVHDNSMVVIATKAASYNVISADT